MSNYPWEATISRGLEACTSLDPSELRDPPMNNVKLYAIFFGINRMRHDITQLWYK